MKRALIADEEPEHDEDVTFWSHMPKARRYTVSCPEGVRFHHEGPGLSLDRVLGFEVRDKPDRGVGESPGEGYDLAVFCQTTGRIVAIIRRGQDMVPQVVRIPEPTWPGPDGTLPPPVRVDPRLLAEMNDEPMLMPYMLDCWRRAFPGEPHPFDDPHGEAIEAKAARV